MSLPADDKCRRILQWTGAVLALVIVATVAVMELAPLSPEALALADKATTVLGVILAVAIIGSLYFRNKE